MFRNRLRNTDLPLPSTNAIVLFIIKNYIPTAFAMFLEQIWVILNRLLCVLKPFAELRKGNSSMKASLAVKYTSLPPQLVVWRALRSGHVLFAGACAVAISTNLITLSLSTLFIEGTTSSWISAKFSSKMLLQFSCPHHGRKSPCNHLLQSFLRGHVESY